MLDFLLRCLAKSLLWLRYRVRVRGLREVAARGTRGIVFLPNHPALIDPIILTAYLHKTFRPRPFADQDEIDRFFIRFLAKRAGALPVPSIARHGREARAAIRRALADAAEWVRQGGNLILYPAGHIQHQRLEDIRGNSGVEFLLRAAPEARVVLVRTRGLWGSSFSRAAGHAPVVAAALKKGVAGLLLSGILFAPRRRVTIDLVEPQDFPRGADRDTINRYLEAFYNAEPEANTYVPYHIWERRTRAERPEPEAPHYRGDPSAAPPAIRKAVLDHLAGIVGRSDFSDNAHLARDLGLDSLARAELLAWLEEEFGLPQGDADALQTVGDAILAACGVPATSQQFSPRPVPARWFACAGSRVPLNPPRGATVAQAFLAHARRTPGRLVIADQMSGAKSYRDIVTSILLLQPRLARLEGERLGILLPASVAADVSYLATMFSGKTPVMLNWTLGARGLLHCTELVGVRRVLTLRALVAQLRTRGHDLSPLGERLVFLEDLAKSISLPAKLWAFIRARSSWASLYRAKISDTAAILFTSGSETVPKAVPLSHSNLLVNLASVLQIVPVTEGDSLLGFLPPFHAFGLTVGMLAPLCCDLRTVHHPNPTDGAGLGHLVEAYSVSLLVGTPTFIAGILRAATPRRLASLRLVITGAEKCPEHLYEAFAEMCPSAQLIEGYGVTECSPIVTVNDPSAPRRGSIGKLLPGFERLVVEPETLQPLSPPATGLLLVRGPCVFGGYLSYDGPSPFVEVLGKTWYCTGDIVTEDALGLLTFAGRLKRFVKRGGEMISLPAIEAVIKDAFADPTEESPSIAVEATPAEANPEIILFTTRELDRDAVNRRLREAGLSPLHNIRRVVRLDAIPLLGTGKTDYRALRAMLREEMA